MLSGVQLRDLKRKPTSQTTVFWLLIIFDKVLNRRSLDVVALTLETFLCGMFAIYSGQISHFSFDPFNKERMVVNTLLRQDSGRTNQCFNLSQIARGCYCNQVPLAPAKKKHASFNSQSRF